MDESVLACVPGLLNHARGFQLDEERAEDLVATTLTWAIDHVDQFDPRFGIENWLVFITDMLACEVLGKPTPAP
ncbi:sigma factor [Paracoccus sp. KR1-242]|uniref:sigma factor n=1 Tax=Paracoccus sp. KR1-242 TaxID=3410028 RepID=UPI003C0207D0